MKVLIACEFSGVVRDAFIKGVADAMADQWSNERLSLKSKLLGGI